MDVTNFDYITNIFIKMHIQQSSPSCLQRFLKIIDKIGRDNFAYFLMLINTIAWPLSYLFANENDFDFGTTLIVRGSCSWITGFVICWFMRQSIDVKEPKAFRYLIIRNFCLIAHGIAVTLSQLYIPLPLVHTISASGPIVLIFMNYIFNGITISKKQSIGVLLTIIGVLFVINGNIVLSFIQQDFIFTTDFQNYKTQSLWTMTGIGFLLFFAMFLWASAVILAKYLVLQPAQILFQGSYALTLGGTIANIFSDRAIKNIQMDTYLWSYLKLGLPFAFCELTFISAIVLCKNTGILMTLSNNVVLVAYIVSLFKYNETPNPFCVLGSVLLLLGVTKVLLNRQDSKQAPNGRNSQLEGQ